MHNSFSTSHIIHDIRKGDVLLLLCFLALAAGIALFPLWSSASARVTDSSAQQNVTVRVAGDLYGDYPLAQDQELTIRTSYGSNTVVIKDSTVCVTHSDCSNQICVQHSTISKTGEMIVCLPHRLSIEITSNDFLNGTSDAPSYDAIVR